MVSMIPASIWKAAFIRSSPYPVEHPPLICRICPFFLTFFMQFLQSLFHGFYRISFVVVIVGVQDMVIFIKHYYFGGGRAGIYSYGSLLYSGC